MSGIGSTLIPCYDVDLITDKVNNLAFAFVAPLATDDDTYRHMSEWL
jgi:hypothetical protein